MESRDLMENPENANCLNCGHEVAGFLYCPACGQKVASRKVPLKALFHDFAGDYITFDSKLFRSIIPLLFKPGFLTVEYNAGRRVRYILPTRLFLIASFIFFLLLSIHTNREGSITANEGESKVFLNVNPIDSSSSNSLTFSSIADSASPGDRGGDSWLEKRIMEKSERLEGGGRNFFQAFLKQLPKFLLLCIPLIALLLKLFYIRRKFYYIEHLIFSLHLQAFIFIIIIPLIYFSESWVVIPVFLIAAVYQFFAFLKVYQQSVGKTLLKYVLVTLSYLFILSLVIIIGLLWSLLTF